MAYYYTGSGGYSSYNPYTTCQNHNTSRRHASISHGSAHHNTGSNWYNDSNDFLDRHAHTGTSTSSQTRRTSNTHTHHHQARRSSHANSHQSQAEDPFAFLYEPNAMDYAPVDQYPARFTRPSEQSRWTDYERERERQRRPSCSRQQSQSAQNQNHTYSYNGITYDPRNDRALNAYRCASRNNPYYRAESPDPTERCRRETRRRQAARRDW